MPMIASGQSATIAGVPITAEGPVSWPIRSGVNPVVESFKMPRADAERIVNSYPGKQIELVITDAGGEKLTVKCLYALRVDPGDHPHLARLVVADRRWLWPYCRIIRRFNMHRGVGYYRALVPAGRPEIAPVVEDILYARWSLQDTAIGGGAAIRWTPQQAVEDVLNRLSRFEKQFSGTTLPKHIRQSVAGSDQVVPFEEVEVDESGSDALARCLGNIGMGEITLDKDGVATVWSRADGDDAKILDSMMRSPIVNRGYIEVVDRSGESPRKFRIGFTKEQELRFGFTEQANKAATTTDDDTLALDNVLPSPDYALSVGGQTVTQGTWITIQEALNAWGAPPGLGRLDFDILRKAFLPFIDLWAAIQISGQRDGDVDWSARISALQQHWRKTFRISRRWMDRILTLKPYRVATIHPTTGTRAPAMAYCDYALLASQRSMWKNASQGKELDYAVNMTGWAASLSSDVKPAPAQVSILDHDQGIIHIDFIQDPARVYDCILPGQVLLSTMPGHDLRNLSQNIAFNGVIESSSVPTMDPNFKCDIILSAIPASPNTEGQLYWEEVSPEDVLDLMPPALREGILRSRGPVMEMRVGPGIETARCAWSDDDAELIKSSFGVGQDKEPEGGASYADVSKLVVNTSTGRGNNKAAGVRQIALAVAAREWARFHRRRMGNATTRMLPNAVPSGFINEVMHSLLPNGEAVTTISMMPDVPQWDLLAGLDASTRAILMRSPTAGK